MPYSTQLRGGVDLICEAEKRTLSYRQSLLSFKLPELVECVLQAMCYYCGTEAMLIARVKPVLQSLLDSEGIDRQIQIRDTEGFIEVNRDLSTVSSVTH